MLTSVRSSSAIPVPPPSDTVSAFVFGLNDQEAPFAPWNVRQRAVARKFPVRVTSVT